MSKLQRRDHQGSSATRDAMLSRRDMLLAASALTFGAAFAEPSIAAAPEPSGAGIQVDPAMPQVTHRTIGTNGIRLHVAEQGEGPLVILCHAFRSAGIPGGINSGRWRRLDSMRWRQTCAAMGEATVRREWRSIRFSTTSATSRVSSPLWVVSKR